MNVRTLSLLAALGLLAPAPGPLAWAQAPAAPAAATPAKTLPEDAETAWKEVTKAMTPPAPPKEWNEKQPSEADIQKFRESMAKAAGAAADKAREFYERFPKHEKFGEAKDAERRMLAAAVNLGDATREAALKAVGGAAQPPQPKMEPVQQKLQEAVQEAMKKQPEGMPAVFAEFERGIRRVQKEFPDRPEIYAALLEVCDGLPPEKAVAIAKEVEEAKTEPALKEQAAGIRKKYERLGKPVDIAFTATDGTKVSLADMKGKVVLVDFWATWCGPCVKEIPNVKKAYETLHPKGFEIVGISFDEDKEALLSFIKKKEMPWPQFFDGKGWQNQYAGQFGIQSIPAMWLIDKKGNLREFNAREDLVGKVEKLLAEK
jgi:thiol-disulfide isomerase/thioredoxin